MKKILPINNNPSMRTYTHHGYFHAILSTEEKVVKDDITSIAELSIKDYDTFSWKVKQGKVKYKQEGNQFIVYGNKWNLDMNLVFWRECKEFDEVEMVIQKQLYSNSWSSITLFLTSENLDMLNIDDYNIRIGNFSRDGIYSTVLGETHKKIHRECNLNATIKLVRKKEEVIFEYYDKENNEVISKIVSDSFDIKNPQIGVAVAIGNNSYYEWIFSNYINIVFNYNNGMPMDFLWNAHKNWKPYVDNYFFDYIIETIDDVMAMGVTIIDYIKLQINLGRYVETDINDNINLGGPDEDGPYFHPNMIYGYDDEQACFNIFYYNNGKIVDTVFSYELFMSDRNEYADRKIITWKYAPAYEHYKLSAKHLLQQFQEFKFSENITFYESQYENGYIFGMEGYKELLTDHGIQVLKEDIRASYLLYERAKCNKDRVIYLINKGIIEIDAEDDLLENLDKQCDNTTLLVNLILKKSLGRNVSDERLISLMQSIINLEESITDDFILKLT